MQNNQRMLSISQRSQLRLTVRPMAKRPPSLRSKPKGPVSNWAATSRKSAAARGYGPEWRKQREQIMKRDRWLCQPCLRAGRTTPATQVDHKIPKAEGGTDYEENLEAICDQKPFRCHSRKTAKEARRGLTKASIRIADY